MMLKSIEDLLLQCSNYTQGHASIHLLTPTSPLDELQSALPQDASKLAFHPSFRIMVYNHDVHSRVDAAGSSGDWAEQIESARASALPAHHPEALP